MERDTKYLSEGAGRPEVWCKSRAKNKITWPALSLPLYPQDAARVAPQFEATDAPKYRIFCPGQIWTNDQNRFDPRLAAMVKSRLLSGFAGG